MEKMERGGRSGVGWHVYRAPEGGNTTHQAHPARTHPTSYPPSVAFVAMSAHAQLPVAFGSPALGRAPPLVGHAPNAENCAGVFSERVLAVLRHLRRRVARALRGEVAANITPRVASRPELGAGGSAGEICSVEGGGRMRRYCITEVAGAETHRALMARAAGLIRVRRWWRPPSRGGESGDAQGPDGARGGLDTGAPLAETSGSFPRRTRERCRTPIVLIYRSASCRVRAGDGEEHDEQSFKKQEAHQLPARPAAEGRYGGSDEPWQSLPVTWSRRVKEPNRCNVDGFKFLSAVGDTYAHGTWDQQNHLAMRAPAVRIDLSKIVLARGEVPAARMSPPPSNEELQLVFLLVLPYVDSPRNYFSRNALRNVGNRTLINSALHLPRLGEDGPCPKLESFAAQFVGADANSRIPAVSVQITIELATASASGDIRARLELVLVRIRTRRAGSSNEALKMVSGGNFKSVVPPVSGSAGPGNWNAMETILINGPPDLWR
ncbi:hypothetical protein B0H17DRAFT_1283212 [Mycena rosella]|uniref:Uncharacterized protein n=1 Tax=Mycena rosella TaxID=1033263 RepID=A0AAD7DJT8_MYCRO|nr:hypothetical protein B0H17DRAFT_1283212 [Mycena rosella]